jgi:hypothetical protein
MTTDIIADLSHWQVVGITCDMPVSASGADVELRLRSTTHDEERTIVLIGVTPESAHAHFPLFNASICLVDTSARGWEPQRRIEVTDADDAGPYLYAAAYEDRAPAP